MHDYNHVEEHDVEDVDDVPALLEVFRTLLVQLDKFNAKIGNESNRTDDKH